MIVDTSALLAVLLEEPDAPDFLVELTAESPCSMSAGSWIELAAVSVRRHFDLAAEINDLAALIALTIAPVTVEHANIGQAAYRRYGRGTGHPAALNFGDCFAYALARATGEPLLFKGDDFGHTDVAAAIAPD